MRKVAIVGVGHSKFGARMDSHLTELAFESFKEALDDANLSQKDIEFVAVGKLKEGIRVLSWLTGIKREDVKVGMALKLVVKEREGRPIYEFVPA